MLGIGSKTNVHSLFGMWWEEQRLWTQSYYHYYPNIVWPWAILLVCSPAVQCQAPAINIPPLGLHCLSSVCPLYKSSIKLRVTIVCVHKLKSSIVLHAGTSNTTPLSKSLRTSLQPCKKLMELTCKELLTLYYDMNKIHTTKRKEKSF